MATRYGQFCPVARAAEVVAERWSPLILRELLSGSRRFSEIRRGVPLMSPSLLSERLRTLERAGIVQRRPGAVGSEYVLTEAGMELGPVIYQLARWGKRWASGRLTRRELDPALLMWDVHRRIALEQLPADRLVLHVALSDAPSSRRYWWLVCDRSTVDLCMKDPGHPVDLAISCRVRVLFDVWMGDVALGEAIHRGQIRVEGARSLVRALPRMLRLSAVADVPRPRTPPSSAI